MEIETEERFAALEAQIQQLQMMLMMQQGEDNGMLGEIVEPLPIASGGSGGGNSKPFDYETRVEGEGESQTTKHMIVKCYFYYDGELLSLPDYTIATGSITGCTVYLRGTRENKATTWNWDMGPSKKPAPDGGSALNYALYTFTSAGVLTDYRDALVIAGLEARWR